jgi:hypothetical protein
MPYIKREDRFMINIESFAHPENPGELNYCITRIINNYIKFKGLKYNILNEVIGVLECAKLELYRRIAAPYEDKKIEENGDVYTI